MSKDMYQKIYEKFFESSGEERVPLTPEELELAAFIHPIVTEEIKLLLRKSGKTDTESYHQNGEFADKIQLTRSNLQLIIQMFSETEAAYKEFVREYPSYAQNRSNSISHLRGLATSINTDKTNCNISQVTGSSVGALGGVAIIASIFFPPAAAILAVGGGIAAGLGGAVTVGTTIAESELLKKKTNEATTILQKDEEDFKVFAKWFFHSIQFEEAADAVLLGIEVLRIIGLRTRGLEKNSSNFKKNLRSRIELFMEEAFKNKEIDPKIAPILAVSITTVCVLFLRRNPMRIESVEKTSQQLYRFAMTMKLSIQLVKRSFTQIMAAGGKTTATATTRVMGKAMMKSVFAGIGVALDVVNIVQSSQDLSAGSKSEYAEQISKAADTMQKELDLLRDVYNDIK